MIIPCPQEQIDRVLEYFLKRFGVDTSVFAPYQFYSGPNGRILLGPNIRINVAIDTTGLLIARIHRTVKPTSDFFQSFGQFVTKNIVTLSHKHVPEFCTGATIALDTFERNDAARGFVMAAYNSLPLGCGLLQDNILKSQIPKRNQLLLKYW